MFASIMPVETVTGNFYDFIFLLFTLGIVYFKALKAHIELRTSLNVAGYECEQFYKDSYINTEIRLLVE
jgi:hypothetical protein